MKKTALILVITIFLTSFHVVSFASENVELYTNVGFADCITYGSSSGINTTGKAYVSKVVEGGLDKAAILKNSEYKLVAQAPISVPDGIYYIQTRVKLNDLNSKKIITLDSGTTKTQVLIFDKNGYIYNSSGKSIIRYRTNEWINITFKVGGSVGKTDVYIGDNRLLTRANVPASRINGISFESAKTMEVTTFFIDYIRSYKGNYILDYDELNYVENPTVSQDISLDIPDGSDFKSRVLMYRDFENDEIGVRPKEGFYTKNEAYVAEREDGNGKAFKAGRSNISITSESAIDYLVNTSLDNAVIEGDFYRSSRGGSFGLFETQDNKGGYAVLIRVDSKGNISLYDGTVIGNGVVEKWTNIALTFNFSDMLFDVYIDHELAQKDKPIPASVKDSYTTLVRFNTSVGTHRETLWVDNLYVYTGDKPQPFNPRFQDGEQNDSNTSDDQTEPEQGGASAVDNSVKLNPDMGYFQKIEEEVSASPSDYLGDYARAQSDFKSAFCIMANQNKVMIDGQKYASPLPSFYEDMVMMIPVDLINIAYNIDVKKNQTDNSVTINNEITLKEGDASFIYNGEEIKFSKSVKALNNTLYVELRPIAENILKSFMYQSDFGVAIISGLELPSYENERELTRYLAYDRPNASTIYKTLTSRHEYKAHPRILFTKEEFEQTMELVKSDPNAAKWENTVMKAANKSVETHTMPVFKYDGAGIRVQGQPGYRFVLELYWAYQKTGDAKYAEYLREYMLALCDYPTWGHNTHFLEVGQTAMCMALSFDLFYDYFTKEERDIIANRIMEYALKPSYERYYGNHPFGGVNWPINEQNWNVVVNKGLIGAALAIGDEYETDYCMNILEKSIKSLEYLFPTFAPDGVYSEGPAYWDYCVENCIIALKTLDTCLGTDYGLGSAPGFKETAYYPFNTGGNTGVFAYHDVERGLKLNGQGSLFYLAEKYSDPAIGGLQLNAMNKNNSGGDVLALLYYNPNFVADPSALETTIFSKNIDTATIRSDWGPNATWIGVHGGYGTNAPHGHVDLGTFEYEVNGARFASEMGKDDYTLENYFNTLNPTAYVLRAEGHNVYVINPDQSPGQEVYAYAPLTEVCVKDKGVIYSVDLTDAYKNNVEKATRGFMLSHNKRVFTVQDEIIPTGDDEYYWFWHTDADIEIADDGKSCVLTKNGRKVTVYFDSNVDFTIQSGPALPLPKSPEVPGQLGNLKNTISKITVRFNSKKLQPINFRATAVPSDCKYVPTDDIVPISDWKIEDGTITTYRKPTAIKVGDNYIAGFNPDIVSYTAPLYSTPEQMPMVTVEGVDGCNIIQPTIENPIAVIEVPSVDSPDCFYSYYITVNVVTTPDKPTGNSIPIKSVTVSEIPQPENPPEAMLDKNLNTRWSAENEQWAVFDLGDIKTISALGLSIYLGDERSQIFEVQVSEDGKNYTTVFDGSSSVMTTNMEYAKFAPVKARYVKFVGYGHTTGTWNSITEIEIFE